MTRLQPFRIKSMDDTPMRRITNIRLPEPISTQTESNHWWIDLDKQNKIVALKPMPCNSSIKGEDWGKDLISPMGIDLQINGGMGLSFNKLIQKDLTKLLKLLDKLWIDGVEEICPTLITCEINQLRRSLSVLHEARKHHSENRCKLLGAHLEGPFIAKEKIGAHPLKNLCLPSISSLDERIKGFEKEILIMTLAPELSGSSKVIKKLQKLGIIASLGHSSATSEDCKYWFKNGITMITHTFNAMQGLHHREPGPIGEAIENGNIFFGLIADGVHINPLIASLLHRLAPEKLVLVSDALSPYGLGDGEYAWNGDALLVDGQTCRIQSGPLAGTTLPLLNGCKNLSQWIQNPKAAIWSCTIAPRQVIYGTIPLEQHFIGKPIKRFLRWHENPNNKTLEWHIAS